MKPYPQDSEKPAARPGLVIAGLRGGSGKTVLSIGIIAALRQLKRAVAPFKKGPDYIDAGWLAVAAGRPCYNLDAFLIDHHRILRSFNKAAEATDLSVVEGNRGLYDSIDREGRTSTAELSKWLGLPVILCLDVTKTTRTMAAMVKGCMGFDTDVDLKGVILNRVAGSRHQRNLTRAIEHYCRIPVVGAIPKLKTQHFPERHMGLVPTPEHDWAAASVNAIAAVIDRHLDLQMLLEIADAAKAPPLPSPDLPMVSSADDAGFRDTESVRRLQTSRPPRIGVVKDSAFQFYYPENIDALAAAGAKPVFTSPLTDGHLPDIDALYIGGGFPETHARELSQNRTYRDQIKALTKKGLPIYAECGGLMYLGEALRLNGVDYEMAGVLPLVFGFSERPQGHGYTILVVSRSNPYFPAGMRIKGHEFHYSSVIEFRGDKSDLAFQVERGSGLLAKMDGICFNNVMATYTHIHALGTPLWAAALVRQAAGYQQLKSKQQPAGSGLLAEF